MFVVFEDMCLDIVFDWETEDCENSKMTECVGHFDDVVTWSVAANVLDSYPYGTIDRFTLHTSYTRSLN